MLVLATTLSLVAVVMVSIPHQASAKLCVSTVSNQNDNNNNADTTCDHQQNSNNHDHSSIKDKTPFLLAIPFP
jgi:hypothetical protein